MTELINNGRHAYLRIRFLWDMTLPTSVTDYPMTQRHILSYAYVTLTSNCITASKEISEKDRWPVAESLDW